MLADVQDLARRKSPETINTLVTIMNDEKAPPTAGVAAANAVLDRGAADLANLSEDRPEHDE